MFRNSTVYSELDVSEMDIPVPMAVGGTQKEAAQLLGLFNFVLA